MVTIIWNDAPSTARVTFQAVFNNNKQTLLITHDKTTKGMKVTCGKTYSWKAWTNKSKWKLSPASGNVKIPTNSKNAVRLTLAMKKK